MSKDPDPVPPKLVEEVTVGDEDQEAVELSLDQLSKAYAEVLQGQSPEDDSSESLDQSTTDRDAPDSESDESEPQTINFETARQHRPPARNNPAEEDDQDNAGCPISPETIVESILFVGCPPDEKLNSRKIAAVLRDVSPKEVTSIVKKLNQKYESENAPYRIHSAANDLRMEMVPDDPELEMVRNQFYGEVRVARLGQSAIDVLAVVAYNQPVTREKVDQIRQKPSGSILNQMVRRELVMVETTDEKPRKKLFLTTDRFLDLFGLESLDDLPQTSIVSDLEELAD